MNLLNSLRTIGRALLKDEIRDKEDFVKALNKTIINIRIEKAKYSKQSLPSTENITELFNEGLNLYISGIEDIISFLKEKDRNLLSEGLFKAEEADDILHNLEEVIMENKDHFKDISLT